MSKTLNERARILFPELLGAKPSAESVKDTDDLASQIDQEYGEDFDVRTLMRDSKDPLTGTLRDLRIDDRDLPMAKNYHDWIYRVSGTSERPWSRQMWVVLHLFGEICPVCTPSDWFNDILAVPKNLGSEALTEHMVLLENGVCPVCGGRKHKFLADNKMRLLDEMILVWGQRSGKSTTGVGATVYQTHKFAKFPMFGTLTDFMSTATPLTGSFVSLTFGKAFSAMWSPYKEMMASTPWFKELFALLDYYGQRYGEELYARRKEFLQLGHKNLIIRPASPSWDSLRGDTRFFGMLDELGLFKLPETLDGEELDEGIVEDTSKRANADEAHKSLDNSLLTVRSASHFLLTKKGMDAVPTGLMLGVSSPTSIRDKVMRLLAESQTPEGATHMLGSNLPTWEVNPAIERTTPAIVHAFARNQAKAERDFGARPPQTSNNYLETAVVRNLHSKYRPSHILRPVVSPDGTELWATAHQVRPVARPTIITIDAGLSNNSFSITTFSTVDGVGVTETVCELMPTGGKRINFSMLYENAIKIIARDSFSVMMAADQWQSLETLSRFVMDSTFPKAISKRHSLTRKNFDMVSATLDDRRYRIPASEIPIDRVLDPGFLVDNYRKTFYGKPVSHLYHQLSTIRDTGPTSAPGKGEGLTDDVARAWFLGAHFINDVRVVKLLTLAQKSMPKARAGGTVGVYISRV